MIKSILKLFYLSVLFLLLSCGKEKKESGPSELNDTTTIVIVPRDTSVISVSNNDVIEKEAHVQVKKTTGCDMLHKGIFVYKDPQGQDVKVSITDNVWTEEHKNGQYVTIAKMKWTGQCSYENTLLMSSLPDFSLPPGTVMQVTIDKVEGFDVYFTATAAGKSYHSKLTKI